MVHVSFLVCIFLKLCFAPVTVKLGDPVFAVREAATKELRFFMPLSYPALRCALETTPCPEIRQRCENLIVISPDRFKALVADMIVADLVENPTEFRGLPYLCYNQYKHLIKKDQDPNDPLRWAMDRRVQKLKSLGFFGGKTFYCERTPGPDTFQRGCDSWLSGINSIRFVERGLPEPQFSGWREDQIREIWKNERSIYGKNR
jgi:hypothetical protein